MEMNESTKKCPKCGKELPLSNFSKCSTKKDGLQVYCKDCAKKYNNKYYEKTTEDNRSLVSYGTEELKKALIGRGLTVLVNPTARELMLELKKMGFSGELDHTKTIVEKVSLANIK